jgi:hypothetical protein
MESQTELAQPSFKVVKELFRILPVLKSNHEVIRVAHDNRVSVRLLRTPFPVKPEVEDVVQVNICQNWRNNRSLGSSPKVVLPLAPVHDASVQPLGDQPNDPPVSDPVFQKPDQPVSVQIIEETADIGVNNPVDLPPRYTVGKSVQSVVRPAPWPEPMAEPEKFDLVNRGKDRLHHCLLDDKCCAASYVA